MEGSKPKMLFVPYDETQSMRFVTTKLAFDEAAPEGSQIEGYAIGPKLSLLCHSKFDIKPNPHLVEYGAEFPGPCLIMMEDEDGTVDLPNDFISTMKTVFEEDRKAREAFLAQASASGMTIISE